MCNLHAVKAKVGPLTIVSILRLDLTAGMLLMVAGNLKLNVHKTFRRRPGRLLNVLCTFNLRPVSTGKYSNLRTLAISSQNISCDLNFLRTYSLRNTHICPCILIFHGILDSIKLFNLS